MSKEQVATPSPLAEFYRHEFMRECQEDEVSFKALFQMMGVPIPDVRPNLMYEFRLGKALEAEEKYARTLTSIHDAGKHYEIFMGGEGIKVKKILGMRFIEHLIRNPNIDISVVNLEHMATLMLSEMPHFSNDDHLSDRATLDDDQHPIMDRKAIKAARKRIYDLKEEEHVYLAVGKREEAENVREEYERIDKVVRACTIQGRLKCFSPEHEKSRQRVTKAINRAISNIQKDSPHIAHHLRSSIKCGRSCIYSSDQPLRWLP